MFPRGFSLVIGEWFLSSFPRDWRVFPEYLPSCFARICLLWESVRHKMEAGVDWRLGRCWSRRHGTVLYCTQCTVLHCIILYCTVLYCTALYCTVLLERTDARESCPLEKAGPSYFALLYCNTSYCTVLYCMALYCFAQSSTVQNSTVLYGIVLY